MTPIATPRSDRAVVRKPDKDVKYVPHAVSAQIEREFQEMKDRHIVNGTVIPEDVFEIVMKQPGIQHGFFHRVMSYDIVKMPKDGGSTRPEGLQKRFEWRVCLYSHNKNEIADRTKPMLHDALREAFEALKLPMPSLR